MPWIIAFSRFWSSNMDMVHARGQTWPGFAYTDEERTRMHGIAGLTGGLEFFVAIVLIVIFTLVIAGLCVGAMFWRLQVKYGSDPSKTPAIEFFFYLALAVVLTVAGGMPLATVGACWINSRLFHPKPESLPDIEFSRHLFAKAMWQIVRMGAVATVGCLIYWLFIPQGSKVDTLLHVVMPTLGPLVAILSSLYYFAGRARG
jgi:hypothetical protein